MKKILFVFVTFLLLGAWLIHWTATQQSYLLIAIGDTSVEMSVWFALAVLLALWVVYWLSRRLLVGSVRGVGAQMGRVFVGSKLRAQRQTSAGLLSYIEGNWRVALRLLNRSAENSNAPLLNYLAAARSAYELGDEQQANRLLAKAEEVEPNAGLAVALSQARMQLMAKKFEACAATLERARKLSPKHPVVLDILRQVYVHLQDWDSLEKILPQLSRQNVVSQDELDQLTSLLYRKLLQQASHVDFSLDAIEAVWHKVPKQWQRDPQLLLTYVNLLEAENELTGAESALRKTLQKYWNDELIIKYGLLKPADAGRQLLHAETWLKERPGNSHLMLTLGRLSLRNELWGKARDYFDSSIKIQATPEACAELGRLLAHLDEHKLSTEYYQKGLLLTANQLPELPLP